MATRAASDANMPLQTSCPRTVAVVSAHLANQCAAFLFEMFQYPFVKCIFRFSNMLFCTIRCRTCIGLSLRIFLLAWPGRQHHDLSHIAFAYLFLLSLLLLQQKHARIASRRGVLVRSMCRVRFHPHSKLRFRFLLLAFFACPVARVHASCATTLR